MDRKAIFDDWAPDYDRSVNEIADAGLFPFAGYDDVIRTLGEIAQPGMTVLDLGTGTGNLTRRLLDLGCRVWATDLSASMLEQARTKVPEATLVEADLQAKWPASIDGPFDRVVSAYVLHEFDLVSKISILRKALSRLAPTGAIAIGDVAFSTRADLEAARKQWHDRWDHEEHYWAADDALAAAREAGLKGRWLEISDCAGVFVFEPATASPRPV